MTIVSWIIVLPVVITGIAGCSFYWIDRLTDSSL